MVTLWTYYEPVPPHAIAPKEYAHALERLHAGMRRADLTGGWLPHFTDRVEQAQRLVDDPTNNPELAGADRELLATTLRTTSRAATNRCAAEQLPHGEPHPRTVVRTRSGLLFVDLETCCRGPIEFDIAHTTISVSGPPIEVGAHYAGADQSLIRESWLLMLAMVTAWLCKPGDDLPNGRTMASEWIRQLRAELGSTSPDRRGDSGAQGVVGVSIGPREASLRSAFDVRRRCGIIVVDEREHLLAQPQGGER